MARAPYLRLKDAERVVREMADAGGELTDEAMSPILGNRPTSSSFTRKVAALRDYGLAEQVGDRMRLTGLGEGVAQGHRRARTSAFRYVRLFRLMQDEYATASDDELEAVLTGRYGVAEGHAPEWVRDFRAGLRWAEST